MRRIVGKLKTLHHRNTTRENYYTVWKLFNKFILKLDSKPDSWEDRLLLFVAHLIDSNKQSSTVKSYISTIKAVLQEDGIEMEYDQFLLSSLTRACKINNDVISLKLPIYKDLLAIILNEISKRYDNQLNQPYLSLLYRTMFSTAYFGLFRASEISESPSKHVVKVGDVQIGFNKKKFMFILRSSKTHSEGTMPQIVKIEQHHNKLKPTAIATTSQVFKPKLQLPCPYKLLREYSRKRLPFRSRQENFFIYQDRTPVTAMDLRKCLRQALIAGGFNHENYSLHSTRSGRAGDLLRMGLSMEKIMKLGRWKSNAVFKYIKAFN